MPKQHPLTLTYPQVPHWRLQLPAAGQPRVPRERQRRGVPGHPQQLLQRRHQVARRGLQPPQALGLRGLRPAPPVRPLQLRHQHPLDQRPLHENNNPLAGSICIQYVIHEICTLFVE